MARLKLFQEPRVVAAFALTPLVAPLLAYTFLLGRLSVPQGLSLTVLAYAGTILGGAPLFELLRRRTSHPLVVMGLAAVLGSLTVVSPRLLIFLTHDWGSSADLAPAILITMAYAVIAFFVGALMGLVFWLIAFAGSTPLVAPAKADPSGSRPNQV